MLQTPGRLDLCVEWLGIPGSAYRQHMSWLRVMIKAYHTKTTYITQKNSKL